MKSTPKRSLEQVRVNLGLTRAQVAADLGMTERHLYRIEKGVTPLKRSHAFALASVYGLPVDTIEEAAR